jgi:hypothetical protein
MSMVIVRGDCYYQPPIRPAIASMNGIKKKKLLSIKE